MTEPITPKELPAWIQEGIAASPYRDPQSPAEIMQAWLEGREQTHYPTGAETLEVAAAIRAASGEGSELERLVKAMKPGQYLHRWYRRWSVRDCTGILGAGDTPEDALRAALGGEEGES